MTYTTLQDAVESWALPFHAHRDEMNARLHASVDVKWSEVTKQLALGLIVDGIYGYWQGKVMYGVVKDFDQDPGQFTAEECTAIVNWREAQ